MKKLVFAIILLCSLPTAVFAANDVTLTTDAVISVGGYTINISGSSAVVDSIVVDESNFSVTLSSGSSITISSPTRNQLSSDVTSDITASTCDDSASSLTLSYSGAGTVTNVITPSATICATAAASSGGGTAIPINVNQPIVLPINTSTTSVPTQPEETNFNQDQTPVTATPINPGFIFKRFLTIGSTGEDVRQLQIILKNLGYFTYPTITGYFGSITRTAVVAFQKARGLKPYPGTVGPLTRSALSAISSTAESTPATTESPVFVHTLGYGSAGEEVKQLQAKLRELGFFTYPTDTGYFGLVTKAAVVALQKDRGLVPYPGVVGPATRALLNSI